MWAIVQHVSYDGEGNIGHALGRAGEPNDNVYGLQFHVELNHDVVGVIADHTPAGALEPSAVARASAWGDLVLDRFLAL